MRALRSCLWLTPLLLTSGDALAWGLYTHLHFAQCLLWLLPVADLAFRRAAQAHPALVLTGALLPDLAVVDRFSRARSFRDSHDWERASQLLGVARNDEERALALGFGSHLLTDIIAHHHFVPMHETLWFDAPVITHALCEWALDEHVAERLPVRPPQLLRQHGPVAAEFVARAFGCDPSTAHAAMARLARADRLLRGARLPRLALRGARRSDRHAVARFDYFLEQTRERLDQLERLLAGERPPWCAEGRNGPVRRALAEMDLADIRSGIPLPRDLFHPPLAPALAAGR